MGVVVVVRPSDQSVEPGAPVTFEVMVRNTGNVVDEFTLTVLGDAAPWSAVIPERLSLFPGAQETAQLRVEPPRAATTPAGQVPIGVQVRSQEDPDASIVEECSIAVGTYSEVTAAITPRSARSSAAGYYRVRVENRGNGPVPVALKATDPDEVLRLEFERRSVSAGPGATVSVRLRATPRDRFWFGSAQIKPFQALVEPAGAPPITLDGNLTQQGRLPSVLPRALAGLLALGALIATLFVLDDGPAQKKDVSVATSTSAGTSTTVSTSTSTSTTTTTTTAPATTTPARATATTTVRS